jgi:HTH-type transcriptional regulator / antitoxin HigA
MATTNQTEPSPRRATHPGILIERELEAREMKQSDLAAEMGVAASQLNEIIKGKRQITAELAVLFEAALDISAEHLTNLQARYNLDLARIQPPIAERVSVIAQWAVIKELVPIKFFKKYGVITGNPIEDIKKILSIFSIDSVAQLQRVLNIGGIPKLHYRKSGKLKTHTSNLNAWVSYVQFLAKDQKVNHFEFDSEAVLLSSLKKVFMGKNVIENMHKVLAGYGIQLVVQEKPDHAPIDGAAFWLKDNPVIGLTLRHNRIDNLVFTTFHELGHVFRHLKNNRTSMYVDNMDENVGFGTDAETEANEYAAEKMIPTVDWEKFVRASSFADAAIVKFANQIQMPAASIRGRLCFEKLISYGTPTKISYKIE